MKTHPLVAAAGRLPATAAGAVVVFIVLGASAPMGSFVAGTARCADPIAMPPLTGPGPIGTVWLHLVDRSRKDATMPSGHRELMVQMWYPATRIGTTLAPYMPVKVATIVEREGHVPAGTVSCVRTHAYVGSAVAAGLHPILVYSPGSSDMRSANSALVEDLASKGYVVVALDHTHESELVQFPGGRFVRGSFVDTGPASNQRAVKVRVADVRYVLDQLPRLNARGLLAHRLDIGHTGIFGFSLGGATAAASMLVDPRLKAGADLDGSIYGPVESRGLRRPFMLLLEPRVFRLDPTIRAFVPHLRVRDTAFSFRGSQHLSFSDYVWIKPQLARVAPKAAAELTVGSIGPRAIDAQSAYLTAFFDHYLRGRGTALLRPAARAYPEVTPAR